MTEHGARLYDLFAALLDYPREGYDFEVERCRQELLHTEPEAAHLLEVFHAETRGFSLEEMQELFTRTFDINPLCSLEVGWHLFGEDYSRGEFLVKVRRELRRHGLPESTELPDHLTHVLAVLGRMEPEEADEFAGACVLSAGERMLAGLKGKNSPYENVLKAILCFLDARHGHNLREVNHD